MTGADAGGGRAPAVLGGRADTRMSTSGIMALTRLDPRGGGWRKQFRCSRAWLADDAIQGVIMYSNILFIVAISDAAWGV